MDIKLEERSSLSDILEKPSHIRGHVLIKDNEGNIIADKDNLVLMRTRLFLFEHLFKRKFDTSGEAAETRPDEDSHRREICLFTLGQGGADINATPFNPITPKFNDDRLGTPIFFKKVDTANISDDNPSILEDEDIGYIEKGTYNDGEHGEKPLWYRRYFRCNSDGDTADINAEEANIITYYGKPFDTEYWDVDDTTGEVCFVIKMSVKADECRGQYLNEIGLILGEFNTPYYDEESNCYRIEDIEDGWELATRLTFDTESLTSLGKEITIEYRLYI